MINPTSLTARILRWLHRFRKRCGYGIHSPFAFNLVTGVIYENWPYYAYADLSKCFDASHPDFRIKDYRLLFRLVNNQQPLHACVVGDSHPLLISYLQRGAFRCEWQSYNSSFFLKNIEKLPALDLVYVDLDHDLESCLVALLPYASDRTLVIVRHIHRDRITSDVWQEWILDPKIRVTFDLYDFGLVYFESRLNKENYIINYF